MLSCEGGRPDPPPLRQAGGVSVGTGDALAAPEDGAGGAADAIVVSPENVKRRRTAPAEEPCDDCAVDAKPSVI